ncbi:fatty acid hydroxylase [Guyanagaster necrorhizus]|uniref:Fatty acid hydroxylase n=1 Tax=Guyanagaster necrorhizus TaxID=856835 RepID=A0A9P7VZJ3_9AGAR|nr:fatty acid hydroxylase [Guyanagaster necrorhizus MCA 3950]KAG7449852.1 fatty acid hydroxylase [Guyanagaster necrorhizus MCA 3950]
MSTPIPQPPTVPFLGNTRDLDRDVPIQSFILLAKTYGEIYQLDLLGGRKMICVNSHALANEISDDKRFKKSFAPALYQVRNLVGDGLFTASGDDLYWGIAHRILMPAFGTMSVRGMLDDMKDICGQLLLKWERFGPDAIIDPAADFTRVALDTIAYCTMSYRLNSFYTETQQPFIKSMVDFLKECFVRSKRPHLVQALMHSATVKYENDQQIMRDVASSIIDDRKQNPIDKKDLLDLMLNAKDPKTGQGLSEENIGYNLLTFLIAGHETSSGMMTFTVYFLLKNPEKMRKLRDEIDEVLGGRPVEVGDFDKLPYLVAVMRESLRLGPTASSRSAAPIEDTTLGGKYFVKAGNSITIQTYLMHRDPKVWGEDAEEFRPERMMDGKFEALPPNAWQPFGFGARACIGRPFAWQEVMLVLTSILQKFDLSLADPSYTLQISQALTIKPKNLTIHAKLRTSGPHISSASSVGIKKAYDGPDVTPHPGIIPPMDSKAPLYVLYGSNTGTSEGFAQRIASEAATYSFAAKIGTLDSATGQLPTNGPIVIVTASFEGEPADNAAHFVDWLSNLKGDELRNVSFTVFGCGNSDWVQTYQKIPKLCDELIEKHGGRRLLERGEGDVSLGDFFHVFDEYESKLWKTLSNEYSTTRRTAGVSNIDVTVIDAGDERAESLRQPDTALGRLIENKILTPAGGPVKRHLEFELPPRMNYNAGDYLAILPLNPTRDVSRILSHFGIVKEQHVIISSTSPTSLPVGKQVALFEVLSGYVELAQPATNKDIEIIISATSDKATISSLQGLKAAYHNEVIAKRLSVLDILEKHSSVSLSLGAFLQMLPPMRVRQYSISSSPLWNPQRVTLTVSVIDSPSRSGGEKPFLGVASNYLSGLVPGERVRMAVRNCSAAFRLPSDPSVPIVMFCAGSGLAPMRGFMQERAMQKISGRDVGKALLFYGCRNPEVDYLYGESDLKEWEKLCVVELRPAFSRVAALSEGCGYVQDRLWHDRKLVLEAYYSGAKFFTCGSGQVAKGIRNKLVEILETQQDLDYDQAAEKFQQVMQGRYATDIFD